MRPVYSAVLFALLALGVCAKAESDLSPTLKAYYQRGFMAVRNNYIEIDGKFHCCPGYDPGFENSNHARSTQWLRDNTEKLEFDSPLLQWIKTETLIPPRAEAEAYCRMLPGTRPGQFGYIREAHITGLSKDGAVEIGKVSLVDTADLEKQKEVDKQTLEKWEEQLRAEARKQNWQARKDKNWGAQRAGVGAWFEWIGKARQINENRYAQRERLIELEKALADRSLVVLGVNDKRLQPGKPYNNQQLVVLDHRQAIEKGSADRVAVAPGSLFRQGLSAAQFEALLKSKDISQKIFAELIELKLKENPKSLRNEALDILGEAPPAPPVDAESDTPHDEGVDREDRADRPRKNPFRHFPRRK